jgi:beta-glucosidase
LEPAGDACDSWNRYKEDIQMMKNLGVSSYRFSLEWSKIEPSEGNFDLWAVKHYEDVIDELIKNGIEPMITLHHFTNPIWFEKMGAFEHEKSIKYFVRFSEFVFKQYSNKVSSHLNSKTKVKFWCTINESEVIVLLGYLEGRFPPGKKLEFNTAKMVLKNLLEAHVQTYYALKQLPNGEKSKIGFVKDIIQFDPYNTLNPVDLLISYGMNHILTESILKFFETGKFQFIPFMTFHENPKAKKSLDFIGLNYYTHVLPTLQMSLKEPIVPKIRFDEKLTEMNYTIYAEGFYRALKRLSHLRVPIIVTENGAPDSKDVLREEWIKKYIYAMQKAIYEGVNVIGYF